MNNLETNTRHTGEASTICLKCATGQKLRFMPCPEHFPAMPSELCQHNRTTVIYIENGTGVLCHDCGATTYSEAECPNHGGAFDCTPFCEICAGEQVTR